MKHDEEIAAALEEVEEAQKAYFADGHDIIFSIIAAHLAAQRKTETKQCDKCGAEFSGLVRKVTCDKCLNTAKKRRYRERLKNKGE